MVTSQASAALSSQETDKEEMINHLIGVQNLFESMYAPSSWKKEYAGWDLKGSVQQAINKVSGHTHITLKDYHQILVELFNSPKDYHVSIHFYSTESATLPFRVREAEGRYFVVWVDAEAPADFPLQLGDEIIAFADQPIEEVIDRQILLERRDLINHTDIELACVNLTLRAGTLGHRVPFGNVRVTAKGKHQGTEKTYTLKWNYQPELIHPLPKAMLAKASVAQKGIPHNIYEAIGRFGLHTDMSTPLAKSATQALSTKSEGAFPVGDVRGALPLLGDVLWVPRKKTNFFTYLFNSEDNQPIGYIRIPHFSGEEEDLQANIEELHLLVRQFQRKTKALVIDLTDNGGGYLHFMLAYIAVLTDKPLPFFKQRLSLTQEDVCQSLEAINEIDFLIDSNSLQDEEMAFLLQLRDYFELIYNEWNEGRSLSNPIYFCGINQIHPDPIVHYTKPLLVLINGLDFSCGDLFPAILQDGGRATLFGSPTAGAGGAVLMHTYPNRLGISGYSYTGTILERPNLQPIENLGVTPDISYKVTADDLQNGYQGYRKAVNKALSTLIK